MQMLFEKSSTQHGWQLPSDVFFEEITEPSVKPRKEKQVSVISAEDWRTPIMEYLRGNIELANEKEEKKMHLQPKSKGLHNLRR